MGYSQGDTQRFDGHHRAAQPRRELEVAGVAAIARHEPKRNFDMNVEMQSCLDHI